MCLRKSSITIFLFVITSSGLINSVEFENFDFDSESKGLDKEEAKLKKKMKAAVVSKPGGPENLVVGDALMPQPAEFEVRIKVLATAINRADTLQRKGMYNPPPGTTDILGLEAAGVVDALGPGCGPGLQVGQRVMALLTGGGNAEYVTCRQEQVMPVPPGLSLVEAAAIPEVWLTAFQLLNFVGKLQPTDTVLIHAGASGVGTAAVQLVTQAGATALVTAGSQEKINFAKSLGAKEGFNYKEGSFKDKVLQATDGKGVDLILDCVFGSMFDDNLGSIKLDGRWVVYAFLGGSQKDVNFAPIFRKRVQMLFSNLRFRSVEYKQDLIQNFYSLANPLFTSGNLKPVIHTVLPFSKISEAHTLMESNANIGKIVLSLDDKANEKDEL